jgi:site-specific recombinase XerD
MAKKGHSEGLGSLPGVGHGLDDIEPIAIAAYIEELGSEIARPSVKQQLAAIRQLFNHLVTGGIL